MNDNENKSFWNKVLYTGMNGKDITVGKFILGVILLGSGIFISIIYAIDLGSNWMG